MFFKWIAELNHYESLDQWGAQEILQSVLEATEDVELLIEFVEKANSLRSAAQRPFEMSYLLKKLNKWLNELQQTIDNLEEVHDNDPDLPEDEEPETSSVESYPLHEQYIVRQAIQQQDDYETYEKQLPELVAALEVLVEEHSAFYSNKTVKGYLRGIYEYSFPIKTLPLLGHRPTHH